MDLDFFGEGSFEVRLFIPPLPREGRTTSMMLKTFTWEPRPEYGLDCLTCAMFAEHEVDLDCFGEGSFEVRLYGSEEGSYLRLVDFCITQL